jgi:CheY-like chemotaxis protein
MSATNEQHRRPAIVCVDDEPTVLAAVTRDLRREFGERYRLVRANSGAEGLELLGELRTRGDQVALIISDQRMPQMEGTEFLTHAREIFPEACRGAPERMCTSAGRIVSPGASVAAAPHSGGEHRPGGVAERMVCHLHAAFVHEHDATDRNRSASPLAVPARYASGDRA